MGFTTLESQGKYSDQEFFGLWENLFKRWITSFRIFNCAMLWISYENDRNYYFKYKKFVFSSWEIQGYGEFNCLLAFNINNVYYCYVTGIYGGNLLGVRSVSGLAFYDWETTDLVRRIEITPKHVSKYTITHYKPLIIYLIASA